MEGEEISRCRKSACFMEYALQCIGATTIRPISMRNMEIHKDELMQNWELSKDNKPLNRINPLI